MSGINYWSLSYASGVKAKEELNDWAGFGVGKKYASCLIEGVADNNFKRKSSRST